MTALPLLGGIIAAVFGLGATTIVAARYRQRSQPVETVELRFAPDVTESAVWAMLGDISGLPTQTRVVLELVGDSEGIHHYLKAEHATIEMLRAHFRGVLPGLRLENIEPLKPETWRVAARVSWRSRHPVLRTDQAAETAAALLGALSGLRGGEKVMVRLTLRPGRGPHLSERQQRSTSRQQSLLTRLWPDRQLEPSHLRALRAKYSGPVLHGQTVIAVKAPGEGRAMNLMTGVVAVFRARSGLRGRPTVRRHLRNVQRFVDRQPLGKGARFSPNELLGLIGWPLDAPRVPGLVLGVAPLLMPSPQIPRTGGRIWGYSTWPGMERRLLAQPVVGGLSHALIVGPSGVGKSVLTASLLASDIAAGRGCMVIDGKGDLAGEALRLIPESRRDDVIVLEPGRPGPVPGLRVFGGGDPELAGDLVLGVLRSIFIDSWGVRSDKWLRVGLVSLAHDPSATLADLAFLFSSDPFRRRITGRLTDPLLRTTWAEFEALSPESRAQQLGSPLNKINELVGRRIVRGVVAQADPKWDMREVLRRGRVVIVSLSPGVIGGPAARLLSALVVHELFQSIQSRVQLAAAKRRPFNVYIDEPKVAFGDIDVPLDSAYELARGLGVGITMSAQSVTQLPEELQRAALTNAATLVAFRQNADDAKLLARELPGVGAEELQALGRFEIAARIGLGPGDVSPPVTGRTPSPPESISDPETVRRISAERYGTDPKDVDAALSARHGLSEQATDPVADETPLRRRKRHTP